MFLLNSRSHLFSAARKPSDRLGRQVRGRTFSRSYGAILPSSFSRVLPFAWECSSRPPVSVCGTVDRGRGLSGFSRGHGLCAFGIPPSSSRPGVIGARICLGPAPRRLNKLFRSLARIAFPVPASHAAVGTGILTRFPSGARLRFPLGADSPCAVQRGAGNLGLTATRILFLVLATHVNIRSSNASKAARAAPSSAYGTLPYQSLARFRGFGCGLEPRYIFRAGRLDR